MESLSSDVLFDQTIQVGKHSSPFGLCCIALAGGGRICALSFMDPDDAFSPEQMVQRIWPEATLQRSDKATAPVLGALFNENGGGFPVLVRGTDFQLRVAGFVNRASWILHYLWGLGQADRFRWCCACGGAGGRSESGSTLDPLPSGCSR